MKITIPSTIREATAELGGLDDLITAKEWQRAAIVWAFTYDGRGRKNAEKRVLRTAKEFAALGVVGLTHPSTVSAYRQAWEWAIINHGAADVQPGERVDLPDVEWPGRQDSEGQRRYVEQDPGSFARAVDRGKVDAEAFAQDVSDDSAFAIVARIAEERPNLVAEVFDATPKAARDVEMARAGHDMTPAGRQAARAAGHAVAQPARTAAVAMGATAIVMALDSATDELDELIESDELNGNQLRSIRAAANRFAEKLAVAEATMELRR